MGCTGCQMARSELSPAGTDNILALQSVESQAVGSAACSFLTRSFVIASNQPGLLVDATFAEELLGMFPNLGEHACKQNGIGFYQDKIIGSSLPHLIEHLAIDQMVSKQRLAGNSQAIAGFTKWIDHSKGLALVRLRVPVGLADSGDDEEAVKAAIKLVNAYYAKA